MASRGARERYIERMGAALTDAGLPRLPSRVFSALTVDDDGRMTSAELSSVLGVSPASVSTAVGFLSRLSFIHRERERGSRRDVYVVDEDAWLAAMSRRDQTYAPMVTALDDALAGLPPGSEAAHRLLLMREFLVFVDEELAAIGRKWARRKKQLERELARG